jgi:hypothetical protein
MKLSTDKEGEIEFSKGIESSGGKENERHLTTRGCPSKVKDRHRRSARRAIIRVYYNSFLTVRSTPEKPAQTTKPL